MIGKLQEQVPQEKPSERVRNRRGSKDSVLLGVTKEEQFKNDGNQQRRTWPKDLQRERETSMRIGSVVFAGHLKQEKTEIGGERHSGIDGVMPREMRQWE